MYIDPSWIGLAICAAITFIYYSRKNSRNGRH